MRSSKSLRNLVLCLVALSGVALSPALARASQEFPGAIQEAAGMPCVPDCKLCHGVSPGTEDTWPNTPLGQKLGLQAGVMPHDAASLKAAFAVVKADPANKAIVDALARGEDPKAGGDICTPSYGCGATIARKPARRSPDAAAAVAGALALFAGLLLMRRRRS